MSRHKHHSKETKVNKPVLEVEEKDKKMRSKIQDAFLNGNFEDLNDDTRSVISKASVFSKGYYRAPRNNFNKNKLFEDNEAERSKVEKKGIGRTVTSEYNYDDKKVFSKINKKNHNEDSQSQLSRADRLNGPPQKLTNKEGKKRNDEENEVPIDKIDENVNGENQIEGEGDEEYNSEVSDFVPEDPKDDISDNSLESIDTPKHISDDRTQQEIQSDIKSEKRERMKAKAKRILEKMNNNSKIAMSQKSNSKSVQNRKERKHHTSKFEPIHEDPEYYKSNLKANNNMVAEDANKDFSATPNGMNKSMYENDNLKLEYQLSPQTMFYSGYGGQDFNRSLNLNSTQHTPFPNLIDSKYGQMVPQPRFNPRKWQVGLSDKINTKNKYKYNEEKKAEKIRRCLERHKVKSKIGFRMKMQNMKILQDMKNNESTHKKTNSIPNSSHYEVSQPLSMTSSNFYQVGNDGKLLLTEEGRQMIMRKMAYQQSVMKESFTNQSFINHKVDRINFRKLNSFGAYVNATHAGGVFINAPTDSC